MKRFASILSTIMLAATISSTTFAGTIVGARSSRTGTIVGARTGNITGARTGNISGTLTGSGFNNSKSGFEALLSAHIVEIVRLLIDSQLF